MSEKDFYEDRIATLRTGIKLVLERLEPSLLPIEKRVDIARMSLTILLDSDLDKAIRGPIT